MLLIIFNVLITTSKLINCQIWNTPSGLLPWEVYVQGTHPERPLGLTLNYSSMAHHHFSIGYFCLHSFMYDEAREAFDLAIKTTPTFIEPYIGKMLACKQALWSHTDYDCGLAVYDALQSMIKSSNATLTRTQSSLISTVYEWYRNRSSTFDNEGAFLTAVTSLSKTIPTEMDVRVLWGLSLLNVAQKFIHEGQLEPTPMLEARDVLRSVLASEPNHPGALHYLIHAYDVAHIATAERSSNYAVALNKSVPKLSHAQHMPAHIWIRTGAWLLAVSADKLAVRLGVEFCTIKALGRLTTISSIELTSVLKYLDTNDQISSYLLCDAENRARSIEWLAYSRLQTGDWLESLTLINDLFNAANHSTTTKFHYLPFACRAEARNMIDIFFWYPYSNKFLNKTQPLIGLCEDQSLALISQNVTRVSLIWAQAANRFVDCLHLLTHFYTNRNVTDVFSTIDRHLSHLVTLSNRTTSINKHIANHMMMMIQQIVGMRYYLTGLWQESLNEFNTANQLESKLLIGGSWPALNFARSTELLAMHLLMIYEQYQKQSDNITSSMYVLNGTQTPVKKFPLLALNLYREADQIAPNRAINTLGMARTNIHLNRPKTAAGLYQQLLYQMTSGNRRDKFFTQEANEYLEHRSSAMILKISIIFIGFCSVNLFYFSLAFQ